MFKLLAHSRHHSSKREPGRICQELWSYLRNVRWAVIHGETWTDAPLSLYSNPECREHIRACATQTHLDALSQRLLPRKDGHWVKLFDCIPRIKFAVWQVYQNYFVPLPVFIEEAPSYHFALSIYTAPRNIQHSAPYTLLQADYVFLASHDKANLEQLRLMTVRNETGTIPDSGNHLPQNWAT